MYIYKLLAPQWGALAYRHQDQVIKYLQKHAHVQLDLPPVRAKPVQLDLPLVTAKPVQLDLPLVTP